MVKYENIFQNLVDAVEPIYNDIQLSDEVMTHDEYKLVKTFERAKRYLDCINSEYAEYKKRKDNNAL